MNVLLQKSTLETEFSENYISKKHSWFMKDAQGPIYEGGKKIFSQFQAVLLNPLRQRQIVPGVHV